MTALTDIAKTATELVVSLGAGAVVKNAIKASTPDNARRIQKISIGIGGFVLSSMVADMAVKYTMEQIDEAAAKFKAAKDGIIIIPTNKPDES